MGTNVPQHNTSTPRQLSKFERERIRANARSALVNLGFRPREAGKAVDSTMPLEELGCERTLDDVLREALRMLRPQLGS